MREKEAPKIFLDASCVYSALSCAKNQSKSPSVLYFRTATNIYLNAANALDVSVRWRLLRCIRVQNYIFFFILKITNTHHILLCVPTMQPDHSKHTKKCAKYFIAIIGTFGNF